MARASNLKIEDAEEIELKNASRKLLFGNQPTIPGEGLAADRVPKRHIRTKVTINLDSDIVEFFKNKATSKGHSYQFLMNQALREYIEGRSKEVLAREVGTTLLSDESFISEILKRLNSHSESGC